MSVFELNLDGLVGATHHYAGLSPGNLASTHHALKIANPRAAVQQGLAKMRFLHEAGIKQALLPPHQRPNLHLLHDLGFKGNAVSQINQARREAPELLSACYSASAMWAANAATVSAASDTTDRRVHFTAANLISNLHRHQESIFSKSLLQTIFANPDYFHHHPILPLSMVTADEGAANHARLCVQHGGAGLSILVYGRHALNKTSLAPHKFPARQSLEACQAIARQHGLKPEKTFFIQQNPEAIDQGVFHNDVICVANESVLFLHAEAFLNQSNVLEQLLAAADFPLCIIEAKNSDFSVSDAVSSYVFNSQIISKPDGSMMLIAPLESQENPRVSAFIESMISSNSNPINEVYYLDLRQSMNNGGGPACLRLRVPLGSDALAAVHPGVIVHSDLLDTLHDWSERYYRDRLHADDLADPLLMDEVLMGLDALSSILKLGSIYPFQRER